jgi:hypothetical protein
MTLPSTFGPVSKAFAQAQVSDDLGAGIVAGMARISIENGKWTLKYRGEERPLLRADGDGHRTSIEVVIVKASPFVSKTFYEDGFVKGSTASPDCWSSDGATPDKGVPKKQNDVCISCKKNAFGSRTTAAGSKGKACSDYKRLAIVPLDDIENELYNGPMLLRVPAASLNALKEFSANMLRLGYPYNSIGVRIGFDPNEKFTKLVLGAIRPLDDIEAAKIMELQSDPRVSRILASNDDESAVEQPVVVDPETVFEQPPQPKAKAAASTKVTSKVTAKPIVVEHPFDHVPIDHVPTSFDDELDAELDKLI